MARCTSVGGKRHWGTLGSCEISKISATCCRAALRPKIANAANAIKCSLRLAGCRLHFSVFSFQLAGPHGQLIMHRQPAFCRQNSSSTFWRSLRSGARGKCCAKNGWQLKHVVALPLLFAEYVDVDVAPAAMTHRWRWWPRVHTVMCAANRLSTELQSTIHSIPRQE